MTGLILLSACNQEKKQDFNVKVEGTGTGMGNNEVKLFRYEGQKQVTIDSTTMKEGHFTVGTKVDKPEMLYLSVSGIPSDLPLIMEKGKDIKVDLNAQHIRNSSVLSSGMNKVLYDYLDDLKMFSDKQEKLGKLYQFAQQKGSEKDKTNIYNQYLKVNDDRLEFDYKFIEKNKDNLVGAIVFEKVAFDQKTEPNFNKLKKLYDGMSEEIKKLDNVKNAFKIVKGKAVTSIGSKAPDFEATTPEGGKLSLKDVMGKVTVIDFWASWCRPCRGENPFVVEIYKKYHKKGLNIIGVSLDKNKDAWLKAIADDKLEWNHVSFLKHWQDPIARQYNVRSIPQTFILDKNGVIRAKNLRRNQLEEKIKELLEEK